MSLRLSEGRLIDATDCGISKRSNVTKNQSKPFPVEGSQVRFTLLIRSGTLFRRQGRRK